jgi:tRNA(adenine34) deaminase
MNLIASQMRQHEFWMELAFQQAKNAKDNNEVPVGAVLISSDGQELSKHYNQKEMNFNPIAHAEMLCIQEAAEKLKNWRLADCTLYVTLEPCPMCLSALAQARIKQVVFGAYDLKGGAVSLGYQFYKDSRLNHRFQIMGGVAHFKCSKILSDFFKSKRQSYQSN